MIEDRTATAALDREQQELGDRRETERAWYIVFYRSSLHPELTPDEFSERGIGLFRAKGIDRVVLRAVMNAGVEVARRFQQESGRIIDQELLVSGVQRVNKMIEDSGFFEGQNA